MSDNQKLTLDELAQKIVREDVLCCVSSLIHNLSKLEGVLDYRAAQDIDLDFDELREVLVQDDWQEPAEQEGFELFENEDGEYAALKPEQQIKWAYGNDFVPFEADGVHYMIKEDILEKYKAEPSADLLQDALSDDDAYTGATQRDALQAYLCDHHDGTWHSDEADAWREACEDNSIDPDTVEAYEHWVVTPWLARKLSEQGHMTGEVQGLTIWGRPTTGQAIYMDGVIQAIAKGLLDN
jgi:hypothetical protein